MAFNTLASLILISVANGIAVLSTCFRLLHRTVKQRLWWDEFWALVSLAFIAGQWVASVDIPEPGSPLARLWRISYQVIYNFSLWTARLSLAVTIVRICPDGKMRTVAKVVAGVFGVACVGLTVRRTIACARLNGFDPSCPFDIPSGAVETAFDIHADAWLIGAPIYMVYHMRLPTRHRRMLVAIFTLNILTTIACIVHTAFRQLRMLTACIITANIQSATSLFVCNLLVVVTFLYRRVRGGGEATSISDIIETVTHSVPQQSNRPARSAISIQYRLPPGARIERTNVSASTCKDCAMCRYLHERLGAPLARQRSTSSLRTPLPRRIDPKVALGKDPRRVPSEKSISELFPCNCHLSPSSTFPELPACELHKDRDPRRVPSDKSISELFPCNCHLSPSSTFPELPACDLHKDRDPRRRRVLSEKSIISLYPCMCNLSPSSTFSDLPVCPEHCHRRREKEKESAEPVLSTPLPSHLSSTSPADGDVSCAVCSVTRQSQSQSATDSGINITEGPINQPNLPEHTEPPEPLEYLADLPPPPECSSEQCI